MKHSDKSMKELIEESREWWEEMVRERKERDAKVETKQEWNIHVQSKARENRRLYGWTEEQRRDMQLYVIFMESMRYDAKEDRYVSMDE